MPDVNLLKNTEHDSGERKKPTPVNQPELTRPDQIAKPAGGGLLKSLLHRGPKKMPVEKPVPLVPRTPVRNTEPAPIVTPAGPFAGAKGGNMSLGGKGRSGERILSENKKAAPNVIPLPDTDDEDHHVNLLSEDLLTPDATRRHGMLLGVISVAALVVVGLAYGGLVLYEQNVTKHITETKTKLEQVTAEITELSIQQKQAAATVQKLSAIQSLIDRHIHWTKLFSLLEKYTMPEVTYGTTYTGDLNGEVNLTATTNSYENVAKQYLIFQQLVLTRRLISDFVITGASSATDKDGKTEVTFSVALKLLPDNFLVAAPSGAESTPTNGSTSTTSPTNTP